MSALVKKKLFFTGFLLILFFLLFFPEKIHGFVYEGEGKCSGGIGCSTFLRGDPYFNDCTTYGGQSENNICHQVPWIFEYAFSCTICGVDLIIAPCLNFYYTYNTYTCNTEDRCWGSNIGASGYDAAGRILPGICSVSSFDGSDPNSACISGGHYKQCCSPPAPGYLPTTYCSSGVCPAGWKTSAGDTVCDVAEAPTPTPTPTPTPGATGTPPPTPTPGGGDCGSPPEGCVLIEGTAWCYRCTSSACNAETTDCASEVYRCDETTGYQWQYQYPQCDPGNCGSSCSGGGGTPTPTPGGGYNNPAPKLKILWEVRNITPGREESWRNTCNASLVDGRDSPFLQKTTTALPGDRMEVRACFQNAGRHLKDVDLIAWLNLKVQAGDKTLEEGGERFAWEWLWPRTPDEGDPERGTFGYHEGTHYEGADPYGVPYVWFKGTFSDNGEWGNSTVWKIFRLRVKNDNSLSGRTISSQGSIWANPATGPEKFDYHPVTPENSCQTKQTREGSGFWKRTPDCWWGNLPVGDPNYNACGFKTCMGGWAQPVNEDFFFWSNWIKINVGSPDAILGNVYNDPGDSCATSTKVGGAPWDTARMKLTDLGLEDLLGDGSFQFSPVTGGGHGLWMFKNAGSQGLPSDWTCSSCVAGNYCSGPNPGTSNATAGQIYNFFVKRGADAWFQAQGGDSHAQKTSISSPIPTTAPNRNFSQDLDNYPGVVSYTGNLSLGQGLVSSKGWEAKTGFDLSRYNYNYFYQKLGSPTNDDFNDGLKPTSGLIHYASTDVTTQGGWSLGSSDKYIIFVNGNLRIGQKITVAKGGFLAFIVKGNITIDPNIGNNPIAANRDNPVVEGVYITDGTFKSSVGVSEHERLVGKGVFKAQNFTLERDLGSEANGNGKYSAELFIFDPALVLNSPRELWVSSMSWLEVAP